VYPSEYAYRDDSVTRTESISANCRRYPARNGDGGIIYIHCDGGQLKLSDSDRGSNTKYTATSYYVWTTGSAEQLLFIFPTTVSLTTITLHYYSDSVRHRPRLRFYYVPDDFDVWDIPTSANRYVGIPEIPLGGDLLGRRNIKINFNFNTKKVLMNKLSSGQFAVSEVEFFTCKLIIIITFNL
jgi:membrane-bound inhibitor of C-type lysozyme